MTLRDYLMARLLADFTFDLVPFSPFAEPMCSEVALYEAQISTGAKDS